MRLPVRVTAELQTAPRESDEIVVIFYSNIFIVNLYHRDEEVGRRKLGLIMFSEIFLIAFLPKDFATRQSKCERNARWCTNVKSLSYWGLRCRYFLSSARVIRSRLPFLIHVVSRMPTMIAVESQKDYHARRKHHHARTTTTTRTPTTMTTIASTTKSPTSTTATIAVEQVEDNQIPEVTGWPTTEATETWEITTTTISTTPSTTTTTTTPPRESERV